MTMNNSEAAALAGATASDTQDAVVGASTQHSTLDSPPEATPVVPQGGTFQDAVVYALDALDRRLRAQEQRQVLVLLRQEELRDLVVEQLHLLRTDAVDPGAQADILELQRAVSDLDDFTRRLNLDLGQLSESLECVR